MKMQRNTAPDPETETAYNPTHDELFEETIQTVPGQQTSLSLTLGESLVLAGAIRRDLQEDLRYTNSESRLFDIQALNSIMVKLTQLYRLPLRAKKTAAA